MHKKIISSTSIWIILLFLYYCSCECPSPGDNNVKIVDYNEVNVIQLYYKLKSVLKN